MANVTPASPQSLEQMATTTSSTPTSTIVGNDYVAQNPPGSLAGQVTNPVQVDYNPQTPTQLRPPTESGGVVQGYLNDLLSQDSAYMRNAKQTGENMAAARGLRNSSIAAGNAQKSSIDASMPILGQIMNLNNQREQNAFSAEQSQFDRNLTVAGQNATMANQTQLQNSMQAYQSQQAAIDRTQGVNNRLLEAELQAKQAQQDYGFKAWLQDNAVRQQDWLSSQTYNREFNGAISQAQIKNSMDMYNMLLSAAIENPQVFTADITAGMQNFFQGNFAALMSKYFPSTTNGGA